MHNHFPGLFPAPGIVQDLAQNTADALTSGIELQTLALLEQTIASNNKTGNARVFLTGGGAKPWLDKLTGPCDYVPDMVFHGMHCYITVNSHE